VTTVSESGQWTTAYAAALADPAGTLPFLPQPETFRDQTVSQLVRLRRGGGRLRLALSNEFGRDPLVLDAVTAGRPGPPSRDGRDRPVPATLHGRARWRIPPGETAVSDPVGLAVAAGEDLLVNCYTAGSAAPSAFLAAAQRTGYAVPGHQVGRAGHGQPHPFPSLYWVTRVLTDAPADGPVVVAFGDSITRGDGTTVDAEQRYPDQLQARLRAAGQPGAVVLNAGLGGNRLLRPVVGPPMTGRFDRDVLAVPEASHVIIMGGINDLGLPGLLGEPRPAAGEIIDGLFGLARRAAGHGIQPVLGTITPILGRYAFLSAPGNEDIRRAVNQAIRRQREWPAADFAVAVADPADPARLAPAFDSGDGVHPSDAGARALAAAVDLSLFASRPS